MSTPYRCALSVVLARNAAVGVILRSGPRDWVQTIRWDTADDTFEQGQWLNGRIDPLKASLSPDGTLLMYAATRRTHDSREGGPKWRSWLAISKVPWLTTLISLPVGTSGHFVDDLLADVGNGNLIPLPPRAAASDKAEADPLPPDRWRLGGWDPAIQPTVEGVSLVFGPPLADVQLPGVTWAGWDRRGRLTYTRGGRLLAATLDDDGQWCEVLLADFDDGRVPDPRPSPDWAQQW